MIVPIEAGVVKGRTLTSWPSLKTDLVNAGAKWVDQEVVADRGLVSSRKPADLPAFSRKLIEEIEEGSHAGRSARAGGRDSSRSTQTRGARRPGKARSCAASRRHS